MIVRVLGSAAGGGVPQWNCACPRCEAARAGAGVLCRTQCSVALSADERSWFLLGASPDLTRQIESHRELGPPAGTSRGTTIAGVLLANAELDHVLGLLLLREGGQFDVWATDTVRGWLREELPIAGVLGTFSERRWRPLPLDRPVEIALPDGTPAGLTVHAFETSRAAPRWVDHGRARASGAAIGLTIEDGRTGGRLVFAPTVPDACGPLAWACEDADAILLDGTFWSADEIETTVGQPSTAGQHHWAVAGPKGSLAWLAKRRARHRWYVHVNNTNPMLEVDGAERREVERNGIRIADDGDRLML